MELIAKARQQLGKKVKNLKHELRIPGVLFAKEIESQPISLDLVRFTKVYNEAGHTALVDLNIDGNSQKVLIKDVQLDPVRGTPIHASFHKVNLRQKITAEVPVEVIGAEEHPLVKSGEALVLTLLSSVEVECLPSDIPQEFIVDVSSLTEIGDGISVSQLQYDREKVELVSVEEEELVVKLDHAEMPEEAEEPVDEAAAIEKLEATAEKAEGEESEEASTAESDKE